MQQDRDRLILSLREEQRQPLQERIRKMDLARDRLNERIRLLDTEMAKPEPDRKRLRDQAKDVEKATNEYQKRLRETAKDMGVEPES
jgi:chromosome segregation ATPase